MPWCWRPPWKSGCGPLSTSLKAPQVGRRNNDYPRNPRTRLPSTGRPIRCVPSGSHTRQLGQRRIAPPAQTQSACEFAGAAAPLSGALRRELDPRGRGVAPPPARGRAGSPSLPSPAPSRVKGRAQDPGPRRGRLRAAPVLRDLRPQAAASLDAGAAKGDVALVPSIRGP